MLVTGGGAMHPAFNADTHHYALTCSNATTLQVTAEATRDNAQLSLLRADENDTIVRTGSLSASLTVNDYHDIAIELSDTGGTATYVVHCIPEDFPKFRVLSKTAGATEGLLFVTHGVHAIMVDYNGVPRHRTRLQGGGAAFRPHTDGPVIDGRRVRYSILSDGAAVLFDGDLQRIRAVKPQGSLRARSFDFVLGADSYLFILLVHEIRDYREEWGEDLGPPVEVKDSVISEVAFAGNDAGAERERWNSWNHLKIVPDCTAGMLYGDYAHLNSLQLVADGDIIASLNGCAQVVRIDRSSGTWALQWKLGGTAPPRNSNTEYLEIVGDPLGEFCGQHHATLTDDHVVLFDNGYYCPGKSEGCHGGDTGPLNMTFRPVLRLHSRASIGARTGMAFHMRRAE